MASHPPSTCCTVGFRHEGTPKGRVVRVVPSYSGKRLTAILFLSDIMGVWQNSKLLADEFAAAGYLTLLVDLFNGDPVPVHKPNDPRGEYGIKKLGAIGCCFGAKYLVRHYTDGIQVGYGVHPSFIGDDELARLTGPLAISAAEVGHLFPDEMRDKTERILKTTKKPWQILLRRQQAFHQTIV
ncbi:hypothetical protein F5883DRAFT_604103 [Diaporthe sp. PMI_573]|nr:hypothetical protein F5883DRAFT_604103 [Diaporthaceae sp. PMI_573]